MSYPRYRRARAHRKVNRSTGTNISLAPNATLTELAAATNGPGTGGFDLTIEAQAGDDVRGHLHGLLGNQAVDVAFGVATRVGGADVNWLHGTALGAGFSNYEWYVIGSGYHRIGSPVLYTIQAGDIVSGRVTFRPYFYKFGATARTLYSDATGVLQFSVENMGPADPE